MTAHGGAASGTGDSNSAAGAGSSAPTTAKGGLGGSAAVMFTGTLASRGLGVVRSALLIYAIGITGGAADAFSVANKLPNIIYMLLAGGVLNAVLVPQIVRAMRREDGGTEYVNRLLTLAGTLLLGVTVLLTAGAGILVRVYAIDLRGDEWLPLAVTLAMWLVPQLFFYGMYTLLGQLLNARSNFGPYMWAPAVNNVVAIAGLVAYVAIYGSHGAAPAGPLEWTDGRITLLAGTTTLGVVAQAAILVVPLYRSGYRYKPVWGLRNTGLGAASRVAKWAFAALAVGQLGYLVVSNLATAARVQGEAGTAGNAAYDNAFLVFMLPQSLITVSLVTAMFTRLSARTAAGEWNKVREDLSLGLRTLSVFTIFAAALLMVLAIPVVQVIQLDRATFVDYQAVAHILVAMLLGLTPIAIWTMTQRVYFAFEDTRSMFFVQIPMAAVVVLGCAASYFLLPPQWWVVGAGAATTLSNSFGALISYLALRRKLSSLDGSRILRTHLRVLLATLPAAGLGWGLLHVWGVQTNFVGALIRVIVVSLLMMAIYLVLLRRMRVDELDSLLRRVGAMFAPITRRLDRVVARIPGGARLRTIWGRISGSGTGGGIVEGTSTMLPAGTVLAGRYHLESPLSTDVSHAARWQARDAILGRDVEVLLLHGPHRAEALDAARRSALVNDARLTKILRVGTHEDHGFIVTDRIEGQRLSELVAGGPLSPGQARALVGEAATALESARRRGVHHLELRPSALYRTKAAGAMVTGLAVDAVQAQESVRDVRASARTDAVGLVSLLYTALTGTWPGDPALADGLPLAPRRGNAPAPLSEVVPGIGNDLTMLCTATFGPHEDGPFTPGELVRDLAPWDEISLDPAVFRPDAGSSPVPGAGASAAVAAGDEMPDAVPSESATVAAPVAGVAGGTGGTDETDGAEAAGVDLEPGGDRPELAADEALEPAAAEALEPPAGEALEAGGDEPGPAAGEGSAPRREVADTSTWKVPAPPADLEPASFDEVLAAANAAGVSSAPARHERLFARQPAAGIPHADPAESANGAIKPVDESDDDANEANLEDVAVAADGVSLDESAGDTVAGADDAGLEGTDVENTGAVDAGIPDEHAEDEHADGAEDEASQDAEPTAPAELADATEATGPARDQTDETEADDARTTGTAGVAGALGTAIGGAAGAVVGGSQLAAQGARVLYDKAATSAKGVAERFRPDEDEFVPTSGALGGIEPEDIDEVADDDEEVPARRRRFNPTPIIILLMFGIVIVGLIMAMNSLRDATDFDPSSLNESPRHAPNDAPIEVEEPTIVPTTPAAIVVPVIASAESLDPVTGTGDNAADAHRAIDSNADTTWDSLRYNSPTYGMKPGIGFAVLLQDPAVVTSVTLDVQGSGGLVQIRATDPSTPDQGEVLAEGPMGPNVTYTLAAPTEASAIVLWFPELPTSDRDGRNRIELAEITLG